MKRNVLTLVVALMASLTMNAQYVYNSNYEYWIVQQGSKQYGVDRNGYKCSGVYGDDVSMTNGKWKCVNGSSVRYIDVE